MFHQLIKHDEWGTHFSLICKLNWASSCLTSFRTSSDVWCTQELNWISVVKRRQGSSRRDVLKEDGEPKHLTEFPFTSNLILPFAISPMLRRLILALFTSVSLPSWNKNNIWAWKLNGIRFSMNFPFSLQPLSRRLSLSEGNFLFFPRKQR